MRFSKLHGLGNDFVVVDCLTQSLPEESLPGLARAMCDRHFGVGADGVLLALPSDKADFRMRLINADGSEAEHCGNGIRCVAKLIYDHGHTAATRITIETIGRVNVLELETEAGAVSRVRVDMAQPVFRRADVPIVGDPDSEAIEEPLSLADGTLMAFTAVSMGNPHAVAFVPSVDAIDLHRIGPLYESHPAFPRRANVEFVQVHGPNELTMRVWERGAGPTLACGTGACATLVAAVRTGRSARSAVVHLPGGDLQIEWADNNHVFMTGPAVEVFRGEWL